jgi:hypothetical protein
MLSDRGAFRSAERPGSDPDPPFEMPMYASGFVFQRSRVNIRTKHLIASETQMCRMEPTSAPRARRVCSGRSNVCGLFLCIRAIFGTCARPCGVANSTAQTHGVDLPEGKRRSRASSTVDMGFGVFNGKRTCCVLGCEVTKNAKCFAFAVPVRDYRGCCVAGDGDRGERHDRRCLVFYGISVHGIVSLSWLGKPTVMPQLFNPRTNVRRSKGQEPAWRRRGSSNASGRVSAFWRIPRQAISQ